jgi:translation initiation factor IF-2
MFVSVSALKKTGIDELLEAILLNAEILDLKANPNTRAQGSVLEARLEKGRGPVLSILIKRGTLKVGTPIVAGSFSGKVRAMLDDKGNIISELKPGMAAEVLGLEGVPSAGDAFDGVATDSDAKELAQHRSDKTRAAVSGVAAKMTLEDFFSKVQGATTKELKVVLKADVFGSLEAVRDSLVKLSNNQVKLSVIHSASGGITESDVLLASASNAVIIGFNVRPETKARQVAEREKIEIKTYNIIYELIDDIKKAMTGLLEKKKVEKFLGRAEVRQTFSVPKVGTVAGCAVIDGKLARNASVRLLRDSRVVYEGKLNSLKRFKDDAKEVQTGFECGLGLENYNDVKIGDLVEAFEIEMIAQEMENASQS